MSWYVLPVMILAGYLVGALVAALVERSMIDRRRR